MRTSRRGSSHIEKDGAMKKFMTSLFVGTALLGGFSAPSASADPQPGVGQFCAKDQEGKSATASDGAKLTCSKGSDGKDRWTSADSATPGQFCAKEQEGKSATASDGAKLTCSKGSDGKDRWTK
ncbi:hypothetical protein [Segniliparus rotundus]|nr:hypothetical protein [Segniliparus rotundus]